MVLETAHHIREVKPALSDRTLPPHHYSDSLVSGMQAFPKGPLQIPHSDNHVYTLPDRACLTSTQIGEIVSYVIAHRISKITIVDTQVSPPIIALCRAVTQASPTTTISIIDHHRAELPHHESNSVRQLERFAQSPQGRLISRDLHTRSTVPACALLVDSSRTLSNKGSLTIAIPLDGDAAHSIALLSGCVERTFDVASLALINAELRSKKPVIIDTDLCHPLQLVALLEDAPEIRKLFKPHTPLGHAKDKLLSVYPLGARFSPVMHEMLTLFPSLSSTLFCTWIQTLNGQGVTQSFDDVCMNSDSPLKPYYKKAKDFLRMRTRLQESPTFDEQGVPVVDLSSLEELFTRYDTICENRDKALERFGFNVARQAWKTLKATEGPVHPSTQVSAPYTVIKTPMYEEFTNKRTNWYIIAFHGDPKETKRVSDKLLASYGITGDTTQQIFFAPYAGALAVREEYLQQAREVLEDQFGTVGI